MAHFEHCLICVKDVGIEFVIFFYYVAFYCFSSGANHLILQKICFPGGPPGIDTICQDDEALKTVAVMSTVRNTLKDCIPGIIVLFAGSWRDHTGISKPLLLIGHFGELISVVAYIISSQFWMATPWIFIGIEIGLSLLGSRCLLTMASLAFIAERTTPQNRPFKMAILMIAMLGGVALSSAIGGSLLAILDYMWYFIVFLILYIVSSLVTLFRVFDNERRDTGLSGGPFDSLKKLKVIFEKKPNGCVIWLTIIGCCVLTVIVASEGTVAYLFYHKALKLTPEEAGYVGSYKMVVTIITAVVLTPICKKLLNISDFTITIYGTIPSAISCLLMTTATNMTQLYIYVTLDFMRIVILTTLWSLIVRCVNKSQIGVYMSLISFGEAIIPLGMNPLYSFVFNETIETFPGAFYLVSFGFIVFSAVLIIIASWLYVEAPRNESLPQQEENSDSMISENQQNGTSYNQYF